MHTATSISHWKLQIWNCGSCQNFRLCWWQKAFLWLLSSKNSEVCLTTLLFFCSISKLYYKTLGIPEAPIKFTQEYFGIAQVAIASAPLPPALKRHPGPNHPSPNHPKLPTPANGQCPNKSCINFMGPSQWLANPGHFWSWSFSNSIFKF